jgi:hypothetical protein
LVNSRITTNAAQLAQRMRDRPAAVRRNLLAVAQEMAPRAQELSRGVLQAKIYAKPIPRRKSGQPKWHRSRSLLNLETAEPRGQDILLRNTSDHATHRKNLGTPEGRPIRSEGVEVVDWQKSARDGIRAELLAARREAVFRGLQQP